MSTLASEPTDSRVHRGKIAEWKTDKGYGFVQEGEQKVFAHIRDFTERHKPPEVGDTLDYLVGSAADGRTCAKNIRHANDGGRLRVSHFVVLALLLIAPGAAISRLMSGNVTYGFAGWVLLASCVSYGLYAWDKHRARTGQWRISENTLHLWEILGGWPGAFIAQRRLRHKSSKISYQFLFWLIVAAHNYVAIDWQLDWRLAKNVKESVDSWRGKTPAGSPPRSPPNP